MCLMAHGETLEQIKEDSPDVGHALVRDSALAELLIENDALLDRKNRKGQQPPELAHLAGHHQLANFLHSQRTLQHVARQQEN